MNTISRYVRAGLGPAAIILPAWLLIGWTIFGHGVWGFVALIIVSIIATVGLLVVAALMYFRPSTRAAGRLDGLETIFALVIAVGLIWLGLWNSTSGIGAAIAIVGYLAAFWYSVRAWVTEIRGATERNASGSANRGTEDTGHNGDVIDIGEITVIEEETRVTRHDDTK